jgi:predicted ferric reductase
MILSFIFMVFIKLPYHIWKYLHKLLGITFLLGSLHAFLVPSDISSYFPLRLWIASFIVIGFISSVYTIFFYRSFGPKFLYEITKIERVLDVMNIYFRPVTKKILAFTSGQFVYLEFSNPVLGSETHPYSISSAPQESELRISAKILGDYTLRLPNLKEGNRAFIYGPYGTFGQIPKSEKAIWIAGGIGVTPFLSQLHSEIYQQRYKSISFYYAYRTSEEGIYDGEIREIANRIPYCRYVKWCSNERKRLTADAINQETPIDSVDAIFCCGPPPMMEGLKKQFLQLGLPEDKFHFENFSFLP